MTDFRLSRDYTKIPFIYQPYYQGAQAQLSRITVPGSRLYEALRMLSTQPDEIYHYLLKQGDPQDIPGYSLHLIAKKAAPSSNLLRFAQERAFLLRASHPHIVTAWASRCQDTYLMPAALCSLKETLYKTAWPLNQACRCILQILDALMAAESLGLIAHRDIKPSNILLFSQLPPVQLPYSQALSSQLPSTRLPSSQAPSSLASPQEASHYYPADQTHYSYCLADFGVARFKSSVPTKSCGTAPYMAPELRTKADLAEAPADIHALALVFYELLSGKKAIPPKYFSNWEKAHSCPLLEEKDFLSENGLLSESGPCTSKKKAPFPKQGTNSKALRQINSLLMRWSAHDVQRRPQSYQEAYKEFLQLINGLNLNKKALHKDPLILSELTAQRRRNKQTNQKDSPSKTLLISLLLASALFLSASAGLFLSSF